MAFRSVRTLAFVLGVAGVIAAAGRASTADSLPRPEGRVILTIAGNIAITNAEGEAQFDFGMLKSLGEQTLRTTTPWTDGRQSFTGVLMQDLLARVGAFGTRVRAVALNDYSYVIALSDFDKYPVLLAYTQNGERLRIRDKGPLWIVYPRDEFAELADKPVEPRMVWQLQRLVVE